MVRLLSDLLQPDRISSSSKSANRVASFLAGSSSSIQHPGLDVTPPTSSKKTQDPDLELLEQFRSAGKRRVVPTKPFEFDESHKMNWEAAKKYDDKVKNRTKQVIFKTRKRNEKIAEIKETNKKKEKDFIKDLKKKDKDLKKKDNVIKKQALQIEKLKKTK